MTILYDIPALEALEDNFGLFEDWEERYSYLIDLGRKLPAIDEALKTDDRLVRGCTSKVWLHAYTDNGRLNLLADSDAHIVRGLVAIVLSAYHDKTKEEIDAVDIKAFFEGIGLGQHLSPSRRNGFFSLVGEIHKAAQNI